MAEELSDYPRAFKDQEAAPWEESPREPIWPSGLDQGVPLRQMLSRELLRKRRIAERAGWSWLILEIDAILLERGGE